jgi:hypothetical protein
MARDKPSKITFQPTGTKFEVLSRRVSFWHESELLEADFSAYDFP